VSRDGAARSREHRGPDPIARLIGASPGMVALRRQVQQFLRSAAVAARPPSVLVLGETGSGKGLLARAIHEAGPRARGPFIQVNCAAIPEKLLEAELFGYEKGAFTDARQAKPGLFQVANHGVLFLDEIGLLEAPMQAKLLTALELRAVRRLGATRPEPADVWVVAATNEDLAAAVAARRFRQDLYHRLAVLTFHLPPLRQRAADVLLLAEHFLSRATAEYALPPRTLAPDAHQALMAYAWPGNVRELGNVIERVALLADGSAVTRAALDLPDASPAGSGTATDGSPGAGGDGRRDRSLEHLRAALERTG
jgi:transcriptional regulator with PAS, ATPase and Fis domain